MVKARPENAPTIERETLETLTKLETVPNLLFAPNWCWFRHLDIQLRGHPLKQNPQTTNFVTGN
jgi:hypothetical protein